MNKKVIIINNCVDCPLCEISDVFKARRVEGMVLCGSSARTEKEAVGTFVDIVDNKVPIPDWCPLTNLDKISEDTNFIGQTFCEVCRVGVTIRTSEDWNEHIKGALHKANLKKKKILEKFLRKEGTHKPEKEPRTSPPGPPKKKGKDLVKFLIGMDAYENPKGFSKEEIIEALFDGRLIIKGKQIKEILKKK